MSPITTRDHELSPSDPIEGSPPDMEVLAAVSRSQTSRALEKDDEFHLSDPLESAFSSSIQHACIDRTLTLFYAK